MESQHSTGVPTCHDFPRFVFILEKSRPEVGSRWRWSRTVWGFWIKKTLYGQIFTNVFQNDSCERGNTSCVQISWNLADRKSIKSCVIYLTKKNKKIGSRSRSRFCADRGQHLSGQLQTIYSECPKFHPNPLTSGGVIAERVNVVQTRHKVFPILGEASASSPSKNIVAFFLDTVYFLYCFWNTTT